MITVSQALETLIARTPYLEEALSRDLINISALARLYKSEVEKITHKKVTEAALIMSLKRIVPKISQKIVIPQVLSQKPNIIVRSHLTEYTSPNQSIKLEELSKLLTEISTHSQQFLTFTRGVFETTIITSSDLAGVVQSLIQGPVTAHYGNLAALTIQLPHASIPVPGTFYEVLKTLAWHGINVIEVVSTYQELTVIIEEKDVHKAFEALKP